MKTRYFLTLLLTLACITMHAAVITLRNGKIVRGDIIVQNDEVVIIRDDSGARFQYPASEVLSVSSSEERSGEVSSPSPEGRSGGVSSRKIALLVAANGGAAFIPQEKAGGHVGGEFMIGSRHIGATSVFLGGGIGVHGMFIGGKTYTFLPLQLAVNVPLMESRHAPFIGAAIGYGFGVSRATKGGVFTAAQVGYRYTVNNRSALLLSLRAQFQQAKIDATDIITNEDGTSIPFTNNAGRSFVTLGINLAVTF